MDPAPLKEIQKLIWSQGDFAQLARETLPSAQALVAAADVRAGERVLDIAAGTGNVAATAAHRGAQVIATDITPSMVEAGSARCVGEGLAVAWQEADAEALPFGDDTFDVALSSFGAMFAPRPDVAARELTRVVRPAGRVGMVTWVPGSYPARILGAIRSFMPAPPGPAPDPIDWGREEIVRERFAGLTADLRVERRDLAMEHPSVDAMYAFQERNLGPLVAARAALGDRFGELEAQARAIIADMNEATDGTARVVSGYLVIVGTLPA